MAGLLEYVQVLSSSFPLRKTKLGAKLVLALGGLSIDPFKIDPFKILKQCVLQNGVSKLW